MHAEVYFEHTRAEKHEVRYPSAPATIKLFGIAVSLKLSIHALELFAMSAFSAEVE